MKTSVLLFLASHNTSTWLDLFILYLSVCKHIFFQDFYDKIVKSESEFKRQMAWETSSASIKQFGAQYRLVD